MKKKSTKATKPTKSKEPKETVVVYTESSTYGYETGFFVFLLLLLLILIIFA